jgi:type IV secretory pathway TraG/TraD family ATPase VirD4
MSATTRRRGPQPYAESFAILGVIMAFLGLLGAMWVGAWFVTRDDPDRRPPQPIVMGIQLVSGDYTWPGGRATAIAVGLTAGTGALAALAAIPISAFRRGQVKIDRAVPYLATVTDMAVATHKGVRKTAARLGLHGIDPPGVAIGRMVRHGHMLWGSWEDMHLDIWGPRTGKTASRAIPNIVGAPGAVVVTSNKRDVVDATREVRAQHGDVWVFDPQGQAGEPPSWYWDPLEYVGDSIVRAIKMATRFSSVNRPTHARSDAYFEPAAEDLIASFLLAASLDGRPITDVYRWITRPDDPRAEQILRAAGEVMAADSVDAVMTAPDRQRAGVYGTAAQIVSFLIAPGVTRWVTPADAPNRPRFRYKEFIAGGRDTIYLLSEETNKMAAPLVLAFTAALAEEAENQGIAGPDGRLPVPMLFVLDEAANVCPWKALPDKYSHFGSRGIVMMTILQSWAQGVAAWGETGMAKLWGAANVRVYGGGVLDVKFLSDLSAASGIFEPRTSSVSHKTTDLWERNVSRGSRSEPVLDVPDLASMPRGRAFVQISGAPPVLVKTVPWWQGPYADAIRESLRKHQPKTPPPLPEMAAPVADNV